MNKIMVWLLMSVLMVSMVVAVPDFKIQDTIGTDLFVVYTNGNSDIYANLTVGQLTNCNSVDTDASGKLSCGSDDGLTQEQVEDFVGGMVTGNTENNITVTYQDADGTIDFEVTDAWYNTLAELQSAVTNDFHNLGGVDDDDPEAGDVAWTDLTDDGNFVNAKVCTYESGSTRINCNSTISDTDTNLSQENVEDFAGGMWSGNTETMINITYQDADGTIDAILHTAVVANGTTNAVSTSDQIYDFVLGLGYLSASPFGASIDDTEMTAEDFGDFTCTGDEDGCTLDATYLQNVVDDTTPQLGGHLDVNAKSLVGGGNSNMTIDGTGNFIIVLG